MIETAGCPACGRTLRPNDWVAACSECGGLGCRGCTERDAPGRSLSHVEGLCDRRYDPRRVVVTVGGVRVDTEGYEPATFVTIPREREPVMTAGVRAGVQETREIESEEDAT